MKFKVITLFPKMFESPFSEGVVGQAIKAKRLELETINPRDFTDDKHKSVDDRPYGGGDGMVMLPEILKKVFTKIKSEISHDRLRRKTIYLSPQGTVLTQEKAQSLARDFDEVIFLCGRYGGVDERILTSEVDEELSIGDYILSGGELAAMVAIDTVARFIPGVLGNDASPLEESFKENLLEHPLYTKPRVFDGQEVPEVLLSGNHQKISEWQKMERVKRTLEKRPDLLSRANLNEKDLSQAFKESKLLQNVAIGLVHYPVYNKSGEVVATNVTNLDIHDIARVSRTYGIERYYIITPADEQLAFVGRVLEHWEKGRGFQYNPSRSDALRNTKLATSVEAAVEDWGVKDVNLVTTSARTVVGPEPINFTNLRQLAVKEPIFLLFGTGYGLENGLVRRSKYLLEPIRGRSPDGFKHLSVRSAVSIILDRLFGSCY